MSGADVCVSPEALGQTLDVHVKASVESKPSYLCPAARREKSSES